MEADQSESSSLQELLEAGLAQAQLEPPVVAAAHLVGEDDLQEVGVVEPVAAGEGDALGQRVEHRAELEALEQRAQLGGRGGHREAPVVVCVLVSAKTAPGRAKRPGGGGSGCDGAVVSCSRASTRMRSTRRTSTRSTSSARRQAASKSCSAKAPTASPSSAARRCSCSWERSV